MMKNVYYQETINDANIHPFMWEDLLLEVLLNTRGSLNGYCIKFRGDNFISEKSIWPRNIFLLS